MNRIPIAPRQDWQSKVAAQGLVFHTEDEGIYWDESAYYEFSNSEVEDLELATNECHRLCMEAVQHVIDTKNYEPFGLSPAVVERVEWAWEAEPPMLYGRFDFVYNGDGPPKLLEYNADTPTSLLEAAVIQWKWLEEQFPDQDQFNSIWDGLVDEWKWLVENKKLLGSVVHFGHGDLWEDELTVAVLQDTAQAAGLATKSLLMPQIGWDETNRNFVDQDDMRIWSIFKLYPWEWMVDEEFGAFILESMDQTQWIEPIWKMILSNKALLATVWELNPTCPYLLPTFLDSPHWMTEFVKKARLGREGSNVEIFGRHPEAREGSFEKTGFVYQQYCELPTFDGNHPIIGSWVIGEEGHGVGIRETRNRITDNLARFIPHLIN